jgi:hypothetical protein
LKDASVPDRPDLFDDMARLPDDEPPFWPRARAAKPHPMPCPPLGILMAYVDETDNSITPRKRARIQEHVRRCDVCHGHVARGFDEVLHGVNEILKDAHDVNQAAIRARQSRFQHALHTQVKVSAPPLGSPRPLERWIAVAAMLAVIVAGLLLFRPLGAVIHAEELITRAMAYERAHAAGSRQRVRQSLHAGMITLARAVPGTPRASRIVPFTSFRDVVDGAVAAGTLPANVREREAHLALARLFEKHHFEWRKPFCLTCYRAWHASLSRKRDTVTLTGDMLTLRTTTSEGDLREVTLVFRGDSYRIVRQTFLFEGLGRVEFEELERHDAAPRQFASNDERASASAAEAAEARAATGTDARRLATIVTSRPPAAGDLERVTPRRLGLSRWLERTFPKSAAAARTAFLPNLERRVSSVRQHLVTLQRLANRSSSATSEASTDADRLKLQQQIELEYQALRVHLQGLEEHLNLLVGTGTRSRESSTPLPDDWRRRASTALPHATRLEYRLQRLFTRDDLPPEEANVARPRSVRATFEALWESIHAEPHE